MNPKAEAYKTLFYYLLHCLELNTELRLADFM